jgi:hypothetical protein
MFWLFYCIIILSFFLLFRKLSLSHPLDSLSQKNQLFSRLKSVELSSVQLYIIIRHPAKCKTVSENLKCGCFLIKSIFAIYYTHYRSFKFFFFFFFFFLHKKIDTLCMLVRAIHIFQCCGPCVCMLFLLTTLILSYGSTISGYRRRDNGTNYTNLDFNMWYYVNN